MQDYGCFYMYVVQSPQSIKGKVKEGVVQAQIGIYSHRYVHN